MSQSNIKILLILATIAILGGVYMYVFKPNMDDKKSLEKEIETLDARYQELKREDANRDTYLQETETYNKGFDDIVAYYPATLDQEISVMFVAGVEKDKGNLQFDVNTVGLGKPEIFYTLGTTNAGVVTNTQAAADIEAETASASGYSCYRAALPISYEGSYEGLKDFIDYVMAYKYRMNISSISIDYDAKEDLYSGSVVLNAYCVSGEGREADTVSVNVENGVYNPFLGGEGAAAVTTSTHDSDKGASIAADHDILIALNNANNDSTDGIVLSAGGSDTYVTSADNAVVDVKIVIAEEEGKNMVTYSIGDSSYTMELTDDELTVYVESSERVDSDDSNGVKVSVENSTDLPVYVKVSGDDTTSPRFVMGSKTGVVKVY